MEKKKAVQRWLDELYIHYDVVLFNSPELVEEIELEDERDGGLYDYVDDEVNEYRIKKQYRELMNADAKIRLPLIAIKAIMEI